MLIHLDLDLEREKITIRPLYEEEGGGPNFHNNHVKVVLLKKCNFQINFSRWYHNYKYQPMKIRTRHFSLEVLYTTNRFSG